VLFRSVPLDTTTVILIAVVAIVVIAAVFFAMRKKRSQQLRQHFGPEFERTVQATGDERKAEEELEDRKKRVSSFHIRALSAEDKARFSREWRVAQAKFVDEPSRAINDADELIQKAMQARGYPLGDFEQRAADISVNYPRVVENYRAARQIALRNRKGESTTEDLRQGMVYYRELFEEILEERPATGADRMEKQKEIYNDRSTERARH